jgi:hypothetical protein
MKIKLIHYFYTSIFLLNPSVKATDQDCFNTLSEPTPKVNLSSLPSEIVIHMASYLEGDHFINFYRTSHSTRDRLMKEKSLFISDDLNQVIDQIQKTPIEELKNLINLWGRNKRKSVSMLRQAIPSFEGYEIFEDYLQASKPEEIEFARKKFMNQVMVLNLLYAFGDKKVLKTVEDIYLKIQLELSAEHGQINSEHYKFHRENLSLLTPNIRKEISRDYQEGNPPYERDLQKAKFYSKDLYLPLANKQ